MAALKFSYLGALLLTGCAFASSSGTIDINNTISGCMKVTGYSLSQKNDPVIMSIELDASPPHTDCPCKSSLINYSATQTIEEQTSPRIEGNFSILEVTQIELPIAVQQRLIFKELPVSVTFSFGTP